MAIYARVSTGEQNPELQLRELQEYAGHRGFSVHREYKYGSVRHTFEILAEIEPTR